MVIAANLHIRKEDQIKFTECGSFPEPNSLWIFAAVNAGLTWQMQRENRCHRHTDKSGSLCECSCVLEKKRYTLGEIHGLLKLFFFAASPLEQLLLLICFSTFICCCSTVQVFSTLSRIKDLFQLFWVVCFASFSDAKLFSVSSSWLPVSS